MLPEGSVKLHVEEMIAIEGGIAPAVIAGWIATAAAGAAVVGAVENAVYQVGKRVAYSMSKKEYNKIKWPLRVAVIAACGPIAGPVHLVSFENGFYDTKENMK